LDDVYQNIRTVGELTNRAGRASGLIDQLAARVRLVRERVGQLPPRRTVCLEWVDPLYNCGHWTPGLVQLAGGEELLGTPGRRARGIEDRKSTRLNSSHVAISYAVFCLKKKTYKSSLIDY